MVDISSPPPTPPSSHYFLPPLPHKTVQQTAHNTPAEILISGIFTTTVVFHSEALCNEVFSSDEPCRSESFKSYKEALCHCFVKCTVAKYLNKTN
jgi:hypothetical protein